MAKDPSITGPTGSNGGYVVGQNRPMGPTVQAPAGGATGDGVDPALASALAQVLGNEDQDSGSSRLTNVVLLPTGQAYYSAGKGGLANKQYSTDQAYAYFLNMSDDERESLQKTYDAFGKKWNFQSPKSMWGAFVQASVNTGYTPWQIMQSQAASGAQTPGTDPAGTGPSGGGGGSAGGPFTNVSVGLTNEFDARSLVDTALNNYLGRDATDRERERFWKQLNQKQAANPTVRSGVTGPGGMSDVQSGGFGAEQFAEDFAKSRKDYAETQASTTAMDLIKKALTSDTRMI